GGGVRGGHPVAVAGEGGGAWLGSGEARVIAPARAGARPGLPRLWLTEPGKPQVGAALTDRLGLRAVRALALARKAHFPARITMVRARAHELTFRLESGLELRLGDLRAIPLKLAVASRVLPELSRSGGSGYLDVSVPERPVAGKTLNPKV